MKIGSAHLGYCLNIYKGESLAAVRGHLNRGCREVKSRISPDNPFGLGLRLGAQGARELEHQTDAFSALLDKLGMYVFTINAFPYGNFHRKPVKESVYLPDWSSAKRVTYTLRVAKILARLLPPGIVGSISTVPITYGNQLPPNAIDNLISVAAYLEKLEKKHGRHIRLALEPEPDCYLQCSADCLDFFKRLNRRNPELTHRYLGICLDTCHTALAFESPSHAISHFQKAGIAIAKIQISAALKFNCTKNRNLSYLSAFDDGIYLHQTRIKQGKQLLRFSDLPQALDSGACGEWRIHFHVPLFQNDFGHGLTSTAGQLTPRFFTDAIRLSTNIETETYTFNVLPHKPGSLSDSICKELAFVMARLPQPGISKTTLPTAD